MEERLNMRGGGTLTLHQDGPRVHMEAERPSDGLGLYKVWLHGNHGGKFLLGTLVPERGQLRLGRTLSVSTLEQAGCWPQFWVEAQLAFSFVARSSDRWYCEQHPGQLVADPILKGQLKGAMLCKKGTEGFSLAAPFRADAPVPLAALICLARVERWDNRPHLVWRFDQEGCPIVPHKMAGTGQTNRQ